MNSWVHVGVRESIWRTWYQYFVNVDRCCCRWSYLVYSLAYYFICLMIDWLVVSSEYEQMLQCSYQERIQMITEMTIIKLSFFFFFSFYPPIWNIFLSCYQMSHKQTSSFKNSCVYKISKGSTRQRVCQSDGLNEGVRIGRLWYNLKSLAVQSYSAAYEHAKMYIEIEEEKAARIQTEQLEGLRRKEKKIQRVFLLKPWESSNKLQCLRNSDRATKLVARVFYSKLKLLT